MSYEVEKSAGKVRSSLPGGEAGDPYAGQDRFGRVKDQRWRDTQGASVTADDADNDRYRYGHDRASDVLYKGNVVSPADGELYSASDDVAADAVYDPLGRLTGFRWGTLTAAGCNNGTRPDTVASSGPTKSRTLDALGNWGDTTGSAATGVTTDGTAQSRKHNSRNPLTAVGAGTPSYDAGGNMTSDEAGRVYAYGRAVSVKDAAAVLRTYRYDAAGRRIVEAPPPARPPICTTPSAGSSGSV